MKWLVAVLLGVELKGSDIPSRQALAYRFKAGKLVIDILCVLRTRRHGCALAGHSRADSRRCCSATGDRCPRASASTLFQATYLSQH